MAVKVPAQPFCVTFRGQPSALFFRARRLCVEGSLNSCLTSGANALRGITGGAAQFRQVRARRQLRLRWHVTLNLGAKLPRCIPLCRPTAPVPLRLPGGRTSVQLQLRQRTRRSILDAFGRGDPGARSPARGGGAPRRFAAPVCATASRHARNRGPLELVRLSQQVARRRPRRKAHAAPPLRGESPQVRG